MIAVIFEVLPNPDHKQEYLDIAARLRPELEKIDGFISVERFQSLSDENKILSLSFFENEEAVQQWRNLQIHRDAQNVGRDQAFDGYRLRVAHVMRDYTMTERTQAPQDSQSIHQ
ncbi:antibiotic biosynthesis monooxygenase [Terasakiella sp. SH-1]|uniref:antibiotic biosynthesis monooxygenase family protein n=1 Tax=Terasakiella sp. SH-1 TaxID=2560057 RepID=UPI00107471FE|nr:antibiotic biosynthesis monooxygenase [Terasakiella sp. SH-1]